MTTTEIIPSFWTTVRAAEQPQPQQISVEGNNEYLLSLLNPTQPARIPDGSTTPAVQKVIRMTQNLTGSTEYVFAYIPHSTRVNKLLAGKRVQHPGIPGKYVIGWAQVYGLDEDPSDNYSRGRVATAMLEIFTSTIPSGSFALDGRMTATVLEGQVALQSLDPGNLTSYNSAAAVQNVAVQEGLIYRAFPDGEISPFTPYLVNGQSNAQTTIDTSSSTNMGVSRRFRAISLGSAQGPWMKDPAAEIFDTVTGAEDYLDGLTMFGQVSIHGTLVPYFSTAPTTAVVTVSAWGIDASGFYYLLGSDMLLSATTAGPMANAAIPISCTYNFYVPIARITISNNSTQPFNMVIGNLTVTAHNQNDPNYNSPIYLARVAGFPSSASLTISAVENHEVVPTTEMSKEIVGERARAGHIHDLSLAMAFLRNSPDARPILTRNSFMRLIETDTLQQLTSRKHLVEAYAFTLKDAWNFVRRIGRPLLAAAPGILSSAGFQPAANAISSVNSLIGVRASQRALEANATTLTLKRLDCTYDQAIKEYGTLRVKNFDNKVYLITTEAPKVGDRIVLDTDYRMRSQDFIDHMQVSEHKEGEEKKHSSTLEAKASSIDPNVSTLITTPAKPREVLGTNYDKDSIDLMNLIDHVSQKFMLSYAERAKVFTATGEAPNSSVRVVPFPVIFADETAEIMHLAITLRPVAVEHRNFQYDDVKTPNGVAHVSSNISSGQGAIQLINKYGLSGSYITAVRFNGKQVDRINMNSHLLALFSVLRGIPLNSVITGAMDPETLRLEPIGDLRLKIEKTLSAGWNLVCVCTEEERKSGNFLTVTQAAMLNRRPRVLALENIAELFMLPMIQTWPNPELAKPGKFIELLQKAEEGGKIDESQAEQLRVAMRESGLTGKVNPAAIMAIQSKLKKKVGNTQQMVQLDNLDKKVFAVAWDDDDPKFEAESKRLRTLVTTGLNLVKADEATRAATLADPMSYPTLAVPATIKGLITQIYNRVVASTKKKKKVNKKYDEHRKAAVQQLAPASKVEEEDPFADLDVG